MRGDHLANRVSIDETAEEDEGHQMVVENLRVEVEIGRDEGPSNEEGDQADERIAGFVALGAAGSDYVHRSMARIGLEVEYVREEGKTHDCTVFRISTKAPRTIYHSLNANSYM